MIASLPKLSQHFLLLTSTAMMLCAAPVYALQDSGDDTSAQVQASTRVQDSEPQSEQGAEPAADAASQDPAAQNPALKADKRTQRYFLGGRPELKRQLGPAIGKPASILPQPYVPKGSVEVPAAPVGQQAGMPGEQGLQEGQPGEGVISPEAQTGETLMPETGVSGAENTDLPVGTEEDALGQVSGEQQAGASTDPAQSADPAMTNELEAGALDLLDPSVIAVGAAGDVFSNDFWQGYDRPAAVSRMAEFRETSGSAALTKIAAKVASTGASFEDDAPDSVLLGYVEARLNLLQSIGSTEKYVALLEGLPASFDWSPLSRHFANAYLLAGKLDDACALASERREVSDDAYWLRLVAFCEATRGNRVGVDFQLGILEEVADIQPTFYRLIDHILIEAEQPEGTAPPAKSALPSSVRVDVLEATMARLARVTVPSLDQEGVNPLAVGLFLSLPSLDAEAKADLMGLAVRRGWAKGALLAEFARSLQPDDDVRQAAVSMDSEDSRFTIDVVLAHLAAQQGAPDARSDALVRSWQRALRHSYPAVAGASLVSLTRDMAPSAKNGAVIARAALISGEQDAATNWFTAMRGQALGDDAALDRALVDIAPLMALVAPEHAPALSDDLLVRWWQAQTAREDRFERANLLLTVLEALGQQISDDMWATLEEGPVALGGTAPAPAQWRQFLIAAHSGDKPKALAYAFRLMSEGGPGAVSASLAGSLVGTLRDMGLEAEARAIATEILISQGL